MRSSALMIGITACWAVPSSPAAPVSSPPRTSFAPSDPFAVAMRQTGAARANLGAFRLCPIIGKTFICGTDRMLVADGTQIREEPSLAVGLVSTGSIDQVLGSWPGDAWLVARADTKGCYDQCDFIAYRWRVDRWQLIERFRTLETVTAVPWRDHLVVVDYDDTTQTPATRKLTVLGTPRVTLPHPPVGCDTPWAYDGLAATPDALVLARGSCGYETGIERWTAFDKPARFDIIDPSTSTVAFEVLGPRELVAYGMHFADRSPFLMRFDGTKWLPHEAPAKPRTLRDDDVFAIHSYARAPDGTEWAVVDTKDGELWARPPKQPWQRVDTWRAVARRLGDRPSLMRVWLAEGSVWLHAVMQTECQGSKGCMIREALLRTGLPAGAKSFAYAP